MFLGIYDIDEYVAIPAVTHRFSSGAAYVPTVLTYSIYEEGSTTGTDENVDMTPASPFDAVTGLYYARRQLTAAAGFERGKTYVVVVKATVDSVSALDVHVFQIRYQLTGDPYAVVSSGTYGNSTIKTETAAIKAKTDNLPASPAAVGSNMGTVTSVTGNVGGNVVGSVGSVTGAVGSVTGNVGGNVVGSVGSVTGAVGSVTGNVGGNVTGSVGSVASGGITAASIATGAIDADALAADAVDEIHDEVIEGTTTLRQAVRLILAVLTGKASGGASTTITYRDIGDTKDRITATVDSDGNRTAITRDGT
jgi:hypothetical protein